MSYFGRSFLGARGLVALAVRLIVSGGVAGGFEVVVVCEVLNVLVLAASDLEEHGSGIVEPAKLNGSDHDLTIAK